MAAAAAVIAAVLASQPSASDLVWDETEKCPETEDFIFIVKRMRLEERMRSLLLSIPIFVLSLGSFIYAITCLQPASGIAMVHRQISDHFGLDQESLKDKVHHLEDVYNFAVDFEHLNQEYEATSPLFWCEDRYMESGWDDATLAPTKSCPSPRLNALGVVTDSPTDWATWNGGQCALDSESNASGGGHRRLGSDVSSGGDGVEDKDVGKKCRRLGTDTHKSSSCADDDEELAYEEGKPNMTCKNSASHICDVPLGITLCPKTCGYCAPFEYARYHMFTKSVVAMLPAMLHQTRFQTQECIHFAHVYERMPYNKDLSTLPSLDGEKGGPLITCIDRTKLQEDDWGFQVKCPPDAPAAFCHNGYMHDTHVQRFHGDPIYAKFLHEVDIDVQKMRAIDWLDAQTSTVAISTLIYTVGMEIFTSVTIEFTVDEAGNLNAESRMVSFSDLVGGNQAAFITCLCISAALSLIEFSRQVRTFMINRIAASGFLFWYNCISRLFMGTYSIALLISWSTRVPMKKEYDLLLHTILDFHGHGPDAWETAIEDYFEVKTVIYEEAAWLMSNRYVCYFVLFQQLIQLIAIMSVHRKLAMITDSMVYIADTLCHFLIVFAVLYGMLAFAGHWMLGADVDGFASMGDALFTQSMMVYGEDLFIDGAGELSGEILKMYWIWAFSCMALLYLTLLNFFLAIVVEGFVKIQVEDPTTFSFMYDCWDPFPTSKRYRESNWPSRKQILETLDASHALDAQNLEKQASERPILPAFVAILPLFPNVESLKEFVSYYDAKLGLSERRGNGDTASNSDQEALKELAALREEKRLLRDDLENLMQFLERYALSRRAETKITSFI